MDELGRLGLEMDSRGFSEKTKKSYVFFVKDFLKFVKKSPLESEEDDIKKYVSHLLTHKKYTKVTANIAISSLRFFYNTLGMKICDNIKRPKREKSLPTVLSKDEVKRIIDSANNTKHRLVLKCLYGMGLRVSEVVNLKIKDIDFERGVTNISSGKGDKQRYVMLPKGLKEDLKKYTELEKPKEYLFSGRKNRYAIKSVQKIFEYSSKKAKIKKDASCHTLRHSFATHLLEQGINIRYIQNLLGHSKLQTTQIYTHVANNKIRNIESPLDKL